MKKLFFILAVVILNSLVACNSGMSSTAKKNKEVNDAIMKAFEAGDFSKMGDYIAADAVDHGSEKGDVSGLDNIVAAMKGYREQMGEMKSETIRELADDDYVMVWSKMAGRNMTTVDIAKFKDGKAVEHWIYMDPKDMPGGSDLREH
jgi:predicted SnoaL-like aldol condensation-catalyzing enzyme